MEWYHTRDQLCLWDLKTGERRRSFKTGTEKHKAQDTTLSIVDSKSLVPLSLVKITVNSRK